MPESVDRASNKSNTNMEIVCFFTAVVCVYHQTSWLSCGVGLLLVFRPSLRYIVWFVCGMFWAYLHQWLAIKPIADLHEVAQTYIITGHVETIPAVNTDKIKFQFLTDSINQQRLRCHLLLSCYQHCPMFTLGKSFQLKVKLKQANNYANPGTLDWRKRLAAQHIRYIGYVLPNGATMPNYPTHTAYLWLQMRQRLAQHIASRLHDNRIIGIVQALTLGLTQSIDQPLWDLFRRTGTTHLMVISGAHISLVAGMMYGLVKWLWSRCGQLPLVLPAQRVASIIAMLAASLYAGLAGFGVPSQRACMFCLLMFYQNFCHQRFTAWQKWRYALLTVLLLEPHAVMLPGFYLSFIAVAILMIVGQRFSWQGLQQHIGLQVACVLGLMPLTLYWFSYGSINGFCANLVAIPWVSFVIVPLALLAMLSSLWLNNTWLVPSLQLSIHALLGFLSWVDHYQWLNVSYSLTHAHTAILFMLLPSSLLMLPLPEIVWPLLLATAQQILPPTAALTHGEALIHILDVGQGLAVAVHTQHHHLVYDTGLKFYHGSDIGKMVMIPYLQQMAVKRLDMVVISHPDLDHRGGLQSLQKAYPIDTLLVDNPNFYHQGKSCHQYPAWHWDGVTFRFFALPQRRQSPNNTSCVLQIKTSSGSLLLTGDIEKPAETTLVQYYGAALASTTMLVPHHGSKTSSSPLLVDTVLPQYALVSYGVGNRYHFPHQATLQTYQTRQIPLYDTASCGMITVRIGDTKLGQKPHCYR